MKTPPVHAEFELLSKQRLIELGDRLLTFDVTAIGYCVAFVVAETKGIWHGRARAMFCRRLKH